LWAIATDSGFFWNTPDRIYIVAASNMNDEQA
jgi:hypothetical protein